MKLKNGDLVKKSHVRATTDALIHYGIVVNVSRHRVVNACAIDKKRSSREIQVHWPSVPYWNEHPWIRMIESELEKVEK